MPVILGACPHDFQKSSPPPLPDSDDPLLTGDQFIQAAIDYLNTYGPQPWRDYFSALTYGSKDFRYQDLTNDGIPEVMLVSFFHFSTYIFACSNKQYILLWSGSSAGNMPGFIELVEDVNHDGTPEILLNTGSALGGQHGFRLLEWNGDQFRDLISHVYDKQFLDFVGLPDYIFDYREITVEATGKVHFQDINGDGIKELIVAIGEPRLGIIGMDSYLISLPPRNISDTYKWDGVDYILIGHKYDPPEYRFQAVQDGDRYFYQVDFDRAEGFYQMAIANSTLKWWSSELSDYYRHKAEYDLGLGDSVPLPEEDKNEYIALASYSYFRLMLMYVVDDQIPLSKDMNKVLQSRFIDNPFGKAYSEMAAAFWEGYAASNALNKVGDACVQAVFYVRNNPRLILSYLGNYDDSTGSYHGSGSLFYQPEDVCPYGYPF